MHTASLDLTLEEITKIEGAATLELSIREGVVTKCRFSISEFKRFYTQAIRGKPLTAVPQLVARICGTCSNAHLICNIVSIERALDIKPTPQLRALRELLNYALIIRDHALHLYVFVLPDLYGKDSILTFDENNEEEHELVHDCFEVKQIGNRMAIVVGGRSVHAPYLTVGGMTKLPKKSELTALIPDLKNSRAKILKLIQILKDCAFHFLQDVDFVALIDDRYSFLDGTLKTSGGKMFVQNELDTHLGRVDIPYSQATGYKLDGRVHMVGALARVNLNQQALHPNTRRDTTEALKLFPSQDIFHNNLAQAIEILHATDVSLDLIESYEEIPEIPPKITAREGVGVGVIEAPRGTLFHKMTVSPDGKVRDGQIVVPTSQNQIGIERSILSYVSENTSKPKEYLTHEIEKIIRAYDPCMSCATHFLKVKWN